MKNSTKSASSSKAVKVTKIRGVKGIVFFDPAYTPRYITVRAWEAFGCPEDCYVYDGIHNLRAAGIPVADALLIEGKWIRIPVAETVKATRYTPHPGIARQRCRTSTIEMKASNFITSETAAKKKIR